jgi:hypothetical protein
MTARSNSSRNKHWELVSATEVIFNELQVLIKLLRGPEDYKDSRNNYTKFATQGSGNTIVPTYSTTSFEIQFRRHHHLALIDSLIGRLGDNIPTTYVVSGLADS